MHSFKEWMLDSENWHLFLGNSNKREMKLLLQEVQESVIGVGSVGFFKIDYTFITQVYYS